MGRLTGVTDALGQKSTYRYDDAGNLTGTRSPMGNTVRYSYDKLGRLTRQEDAGGRTETYAYDQVGNLISSKVNGKHETRYDYDNKGNLTKETNALGISVKYSYDAINRLTGVTDGNGGRTSYAYDHNSQLVSITDPLGGVTAFAYDGDGNLTGFTDGEGREASYTYDLADRLTSARTGSGETGEKEREVRTAAYSYDSVGNVISSTDGNGNETAYSYDLLGNLTEKTNGLGEKEQYAYDENNRLSRITRADGNSIRYDYNKLDELLKKEYSEKADGQVLYAYDPDGRRVSMEDLTGTTSYEYDETGRITGLQQGDGSVIRYSYDSFGNLESLIYPDGSAVSYEYDALDRLVQVTDREGKKTRYTYDKAGNMVKVNRANGTSAKVSYDSAGQVTEVQNLDKKGKPQSSYRYGYDLSGSIRTEEIRTLDGKGHKTAVIWSYTYDLAGQLTGAEKRDKDGTLLETTVYGYDGAGNRIQTSTSLYTIQKAVTENNQYNGANQLISSARSENPKAVKGIEGTKGGDGAAKENGGELTEYLYDKNGNRIRELKNGEEVQNYVYDTENRLIAVRDDKGLLMAALYDGDGNRMFTAERTEDTNAYQLFARKKASPKTSAQGKESSIFWYGFGQNFIQALHVAKETLGRVWKDTWEELVSAYHRKIAKDRADDEGLVVNPDGITDMPGDGEVTYPSETGQALIPYQITEETYDYYEVRNYVNDINQDYTQVLTGYDEKGRIRESYTYGITGNSGGESSSVTGTGIGAAIGGRLDYSDGKNTWYYGYTGTGSVAQLTDKAGELAAAYRYDAFGNTSVQDYIGNITGNKKITENYTRNPYTFNAEYTDASTGNQYLRARYYSPETGNFFTEDSYLGNLREPLERNLYTYAENDPVNYSDPSGHGIKSKLKKAWNTVKTKVTKAASNLYNKAKTGLNNYMNSTTYRSYFWNASSTNRKGHSGASTGNRYVGRSSGVSGIVSRIGASTGNRYISTTSIYPGKVGGRTAYTYVNRNGIYSYNQNSGGNNVQYFWSLAEEETIRQHCTTARHVERGSTEEKVIITAAAMAAAIAATALTGGSAAGAIGTVLGIKEGTEGALLLGGVVKGTIYGSTYSGVHSALSGNDTQTVLKDTLTGGVAGGWMGGLSASLKLALSGGIEAGEAVVAENASRGEVPDSQQMHEAVSTWSAYQKELAPSNRKANHFNTATVAYDINTGQYYYGMNKGVRLSGDTLNQQLLKLLPETTFNDYEIGNCAEVDAVNQALNNGAKLSDLNLYTIDVKKGVPKPMCENCVYTFEGHVNNVITN